MSVTLQQDQSITSFSEKKHGHNYKLQIVWRNVLLMTLLHIGGLYGFFVVGLKPEVAWWAILLPDLTARIGAMGITAGAHR